MFYPLYNALLGLTAPAVRVWLARSSRHADLAARFHPEVPPPGKAPIWLHACSVGEVQAAKPLAAALAATLPGVPVLLSTSTAAGRRAAQAHPGWHAVWCPFDTRRAVRAFLDAARPRCLVLIETEIWPNLLRETRQRGLPVILVNGRLSDKHFARYSRWRRLLRPVFSEISVAGVQNEKYADRFEALGVTRSNIHVTGNLKFDSLTLAIDKEIRTCLRRQSGIPEQAPVLVFGSTRPGEEAAALEAWHALRGEFPELRLIVVPRHPARLPEIQPLFKEPVLLRSKAVAGRAPAGEHILLVDTLGELGAFYALATAAVVCGSLCPGVNGHNPLEPAALGVPTFFGPHMGNFEDPARVLLEARGAQQANAPGALTEALRGVLANPAAQRQMGTRARAAILAHQGAAQRNAVLIAQTLQHPAAAK